MVDLEFRSVVKADNSEPPLRVTDMAFFSEDVHLLAAVVAGGWAFVWEIKESSSTSQKSKNQKRKKNMPQILDNILVAIHISVEGEYVRPRVCWHCHNKQVLFVGVGTRILRIDTIMATAGRACSVENPLKCPVEKLIDGVHLVGEHDGEVTGLSMCNCSTPILVSASADGKIKIWDDSNSSLITVLEPHNGLAVNSVNFLIAPQIPDHIVLITTGPLNREIKIWAPESKEGGLLLKSWHCREIFNLKSSDEPRDEEEVFNKKVVALSQVGLLLVASSKENALHSIHLDYGPNPKAARIDHVKVFGAPMPILCFTGRLSSPHVNPVVQGYCVHNDAIKQYTFNLSQCLPPPMDKKVFDRSDSSDGFTKAAFSQIQTEQEVELHSIPSEQEENSFCSQASDDQVDGASDGFNEAVNSLSPCLQRLLTEIEAPSDPLEELAKLVNEQNYEAAFTLALERRDVWIVSWLCCQVDPDRLWAMSPCPLSQEVLLSLLQQLSVDIGKETTLKLKWMTNVAAAIEPRVMIRGQVEYCFDQVIQNIENQLRLSTNADAETASMIVLTSIINSKYRNI